jgi:hypothetical protein
MASTELSPAGGIGKEELDERAQQYAEWEAGRQRLRAAGWPEALVKALYDYFDYAARVRGLGVVRFREAEDLGHGWVRLKDLFWTDDDPASAGLPYSFERGVDVRVSDVMWCADAAWVAQQARNLALHIDETGQEATHLLRDRDTKFTGQFDAILKSEGIEVKPVSVGAPNMNAYVASCTSSS